MAEGKNLYETVIVTSAKLGEEGSAELVNKFKALIAEHGTVESVDDWGKRRFAYPIAKQTEGYYTLITSRAARVYRRAGPAPWHYRRHPAQSHCQAGPPPRGCPERPEGQEG